MSDFKKLTFSQKIEALTLAIKYWIKGDNWQDGLDFAVSLIKRWKKP